MLELKHIKKSFDGVTVLKNINLEIEDGEIVSILGPSGCGKTTLLKVLGMIDKQTGGTVRFMGEDTEKLDGDRLADIRRTKLGFIFQDYYLMDSLTVEENIMLSTVSYTPLTLPTERIKLEQGTREAIKN